MNHRPLAILLIASQSLVLHSPARAAGPEPENLVWTTPGADSRDSMPLGNGDIGLNVWTEANGDLVFYISKTDTWGPRVEHEKGLLKVGKVRVKMSPASPFVRQSLIPAEGAIEIQSTTATTRIWVDANRPVIRVETKSTEPATLQAGFESLRPATDGDLAADLVFEGQQDRVAWCYRNSNQEIPALKNLTFGAVMQGDGFANVDKATLKTKHSVHKASISIHPLTAQTDNPEQWLDLAAKSSHTAGAGDWNAHVDWWNAFWNRSWILAGSTNNPALIPPNTHTLRAGSDQTGNNRFAGELRNVRLADDLSGAFTLEADVNPAPGESGRIFDKLTPGQGDGFLLDLQPDNTLRLLVGSGQHTAKDVAPAGQWSKVVLSAGYDAWRVTVNGKEVITVPGQTDVATLSRNYALQRFVSACAGRGAYPIKFNGSLFTMDWQVREKSNGGETTRVMSPDFRSWGGMYWFQNTRAMYWPMLQSGDFEMMLPLFRMYQNQLPGNAKQVREFYGHDGAYLAETKPFCGGIPNIKPGEEGGYTTHYYTPILELSAMMLDYFAYTGDHGFLEQSLLPVAEAGLTFYAQHFKRENGRLLLDPSNAVETYWAARNPAPDIAGLRWVLRGLLALPRDLTTDTQRARWERFLGEIPELPVGEKDGKRVILPAEKYGEPRNSENPELYAIYPFRHFGIGKHHLDLAHASFAARRSKMNGCWTQDGIQAALLGDTETAAANALAVFSRREPQCRFPVFWEAGFDYVPDQDNGGNGLNVLQLMLLQSEGDTIRLLPAWPKDWDVHFKLHAPRDTTVECEYREGKVVKLIVTPESRAKDVVHESIQSSETSSLDDNTLWFRPPAANWNAALPLGNGRLGAMIFGGVAEERIQLNEDTLWSGAPHDYNRTGAGAHLAEIRKLIDEEKFEDAKQLGDREMLGSPPSQASYQPLGDLKLAFRHGGEATGYRRELDMRDAVARTRYQIGTTRFTRETFISHPDQVMVVRLTCDQPGGLDFDVGLSSPQEHAVSTQGDSGLLMTGEVNRGHIPEGKHGTRFAAGVMVQTDGGKIAAGQGKLIVSGATAATLLYSAATSYRNYQDNDGDARALCEKHLQAAASKPWEQLRAAHVADVRALFDRVRMDLGGHEANQRPTDERIAAVHRGAADPLLAAQYFQLGRYLTIAGSRPGTQPMTLQGIWNESVEPNWGSRYTLNCNLEINYSLTELANLGELHEPLLRMIDELRVPGRVTAKNQYNCGGWMLHHNTDIWRGTAIVDGFQWGAWPTAGAWLCRHLWEHYDFSRDKAWLARAYPVMKEAAEFFADFLIPDKHGNLVTTPTISFEQTFTTLDGKKGVHCAGPTMDMQMLRDLFGHCISASEILGVDVEFREKLVAMRAKLIPTRISPRTGQIMEWREDWNADNWSGQLAPLWGLWPGDEITPHATPDLTTAARKTMMSRDMMFGSWCSAVRLNYAARMRDGALAEDMLNRHMRDHLMPNLLSKFSDGWGFQIDGNLGVAAGIGELLLQSHEAVITLLPALPPSWKNGSVTGLRTRGGFEVGIAWKHGKLTGATIRSVSGTKCKVRYADKTIDLDLPSGTTKELTL